MLEEKIKCKEEKKSGGSVVKSPPVDAADTGSIPAQGTKIPCVSGQLSSSATARNARAPQLERRSCAATKSQCNQINKYLKIGKKKKARTREMTRCFGAEKEWCEVGMFVCLYVLSFHSFQSSGGGVYLAQMKGQRKLCPFTPPDRDRRVDSHVLSARGSRRSPRTSG